MIQRKEVICHSQLNNAARLQLQAEHTALCQAQSTGAEQLCPGRNRLGVILGVGGGGGKAPKAGRPATKTQQREERPAHPPASPETI